MLEFPQVSHQKENKQTKITKLLFLGLFLRQDSQKQIGSVAQASLELFTTQCILG